MNKNPDSRISFNIAEVIAQLPNASGVYMYYQGEQLLYVGKAKSLKNRVRSYFAFTPFLRPNPRVSERIKLMLNSANRLLYHTTPSELDALVLENSLIKQLHPKFNILLRDDKTYPYICVDFSQEFARLQITRQIKSGGQYKYFGPYTSGAKALLEAIYEIFALRQKRSCKKICLFAQINRCLAPCENAQVVKDAYDKELNAAIKALKNPKNLITILESKMLAAAQKENFEQAARYRDLMQAIEKISGEHSQLDLARDVSFDAIACVKMGEIIEAIRLVIEHGRVISIIKERARGDDEDEFLKAFLLSQYKLLAPKKIYLEREISDSSVIEELIKTRTKVAAKICAAKSPDVRKLLQNAKNSALDQMTNAKTSSGKEAMLAALLGLERVPQRIEVFDNSMLQGSAIIGAMVSYEDGWRKENYRKFLLDSRNDYEQMRQMLSRRIGRFSEHGAPDLWVIDGGKALLDLATSLLAQAGANVDVIAISKEKHNHLAYRAKGHANDLIYHGQKVLKLGADNKVLQFVQMLRDEAHRFVINAHRGLKRKQDLKLSRLTTAGISAASVAKLVKYFGTFEAIMAASFDEIRAASNKSVAEKIMKLKS